MSITQLIGIAFFVACSALAACAAEPPTPSLSGPLKEVAPSELKIPPPKPEPREAKPKESTQAPVKPAPAESRTPEEATERAADPKDPAGANIIKVPVAPGAKP
jgi:hypothetical protein